VPRKFLVCDERWVLRQIETNTKLRVTELATEIENHRHKKFNPETFRRMLRKNDFHGREAGENSFVSQKNQKNATIPRLFSGASSITLCYIPFPSNGESCITRS
jgi:hypothetical protein